MSLRDALADQALSCDALGSPFTALVLRLLAERLRRGTPLSDRLFAWSGDIGSSGASVPLRLASALHGLVISGRAPALAACYPPNPWPKDSDLWSGIETTLDAQAGWIAAWIDRPPQTNEVGRSAVLIAAGHLLAAEFGQYIRLSELGASAGLNLMWDHFALQVGKARYGPRAPVLTLAPDWRGDPPPVAPPEILDRRGVDLTPLDPRAYDDALRLMAYIWPDQPERLARTHAAIAVADATVDVGNAADWLETRLRTPGPAGALHLIFHTVAWQYFPPATQSRVAQLIKAAGNCATITAPLAWLGMEADSGGPGAALTLQLWPGDRRMTLGRADFHGRWIDWRPTAR